MRDYKEYTIYDAVTPIAITSSTDATPIVVTATAHGFSNGDLVLIYGHTTNIAANGIYRAANVAANTLDLTDINTGANIAGTGGGAGGATGIILAAPKVPLVSDFRHAEFSLFTTGTATLNMRTAGSLGKLDGESPNFAATQGPTNPYAFVEVIDLEDEALVVGDTGIALVAADAAAQYEVNINGLKYLTFWPATWSQGAITLKLKVFSSD